RNDLIGVDVVAHERHDLARKLHDSSSRGSVTRPRTAEAAAVSGLAKKVRPPRPCRPSKLRFDVETAYCPGSSASPFMAMHIEQPGSRHSAPAARKMRSSPSASAARLTACEPGTTSTRSPPATRRPSKMRAACRRSDSRELV